MTQLSVIYKVILAVTIAFSAGLIMSAQAQTNPRLAPPPPPPPASLPPASAPITPPSSAPSQTPAAAASQAAAAGPAQTPSADPKDVATMDAIVAAVYDVISGPAGQKRNWDRFRSLFVSGARLIPTGRNPQTGEVASRVHPARQRTRPAHQACF